MRMLIWSKIHRWIKSKIVWLKIRVSCPSKISQIKAQILMCDTHINNRLCQEGKD